MLADAPSWTDEGSDLAAQDAALSDVEQWVNSQLNVFKKGAFREKPVHSKCTVVKTSSKSRAQAEADFAKLNELPDHPDRWLAEYHVRLHKDPEQIVWDVHYKSRSAWAAEEKHDYGVIRSGGTDRDRWTYFVPTDPLKSGGGALNIVRTGVGFPNIMNSARDLGGVEFHLGTILAGGLPQFVARDAGKVTSSNGVYTVELVGSKDEWVVQVTVTKSRSGGWRVLEIESQFTPERSIRTKVRYEYSASPQDSEVPSRVVTVRDDGVIETFTNITVERIDNAAVHAVSAIPTPAKDIEVRDFRNPDAAASEQYKKYPVTTWNLKNEEDEYRQVEAVNPGMGGSDRRDEVTVKHYPSLFPFLSIGGIVTLLLVAWRWRSRVKA